MKHDYDTDINYNINQILTAPSSPFSISMSHDNGTERKYWSNEFSTLQSLLEHGRTHDAKEFVVYEDERITYKDWYLAVRCLADYFQQRGIKKGDRIALAMRNLPEWPVAFFAATSIGAICVPLNAWWTGPELSFGLQNSGSRILVCDEERYQRLATNAASADTISHLDEILVARASADFDGRRLEDVIGPTHHYGNLTTDTPSTTPALTPDDPATILYTSGTTAFPKGAINSHRNLASHVQTTGYFTARAALRRGDAFPSQPSTPILLIVVPLFHVTGCAAGMIGAIAAGGKIILMPRWDAGRALQLIDKEKITFTGGVPTIAWELIDHPERENFDLSSLASVGYGGAPAATELADHVHNRLGAMPGNGWGMTETSGTVLSHTAEEYLENPSSCGIPVPVADAKIMQVGGSTEVPLGSIGELWIKGPMVAQGYWNNPEATAETFVNGWVRTGDLARQDEQGYYYIVDRLKDMILRGGENIYTAEVENILFAHPAIVDASVVGLPHRSLGEEPAAAVTLATGAIATESELQQWTRQHLAAFKCPIAIKILPTRLPRNANGKIMKDQVRKLFADRTDPTQ